MHASGGQPLKKACPSFCIDLRTSRPSGSCHSDPFQRWWWWWCSRSRWQIVHVPRCLRRRWPKFPHEVLETCTVLRSGKKGRWSLGLRGWSLGLRGWPQFRTNHVLWISLGQLPQPRYQALLVPRPRYQAPLVLRLDHVPMSVLPVLSNRTCLDHNSRSTVAHP